MWQPTEWERKVVFKVLFRVERMEMEKLFLVTMFGAVIMVQAFGIINGCFLEAKAALLKFKSTYFNASVLPSWVEDDPRKNNCCQWERVTCDSTSSHVIHLDLHWVQTDMHMCADNNIYSLNWSLFQTFKELRTLDLSSNCIHGFIWNADYMNLAALETLDLSYNSVNISIMESLSALTSLKNLFLAENKLSGPLPTKELSLLLNLELLDLSYNGLSSPLTTQDAKAFLKLKKLKMLNLRSNEFDKGVLNSFLGLPALKSLYLSDNQNLKGLKESFSIEEFCKMKQLQDLDLSSNYITGKLDLCLGNLTFLRALDLSHNSLSGNIPSFLFAQLSSLEYLSLSNNKFEGLFSLSTLANHSKLKILELGKMDTQTFHVETENPPWIPSFQLEYLDISHCLINLPTKSIPSFLLYQHALALIDMSYDNLVGMLPNWLLLNNPKLESVLLNGNSFSGSFKLPFDLNHSLDQLDVLDLSNNHIQGGLPSSIGFILPNLIYFNVSSNMFSGHISASIGEMSSLIILDLASNNFSGEVPKQILLRCVSLWSMSLSNNNLQGQIFSTPMTNMVGLIFLRMDNNHFNGTLPSWIGKLGLYILSLSGNNFEGEIKELCQLVNLGYLDLSHNRFIGAIPSCFSMSLARFIHLRGNNLSGTIPESFLNSFSLVTIDLRDNNFKGSIPKIIFELQSLTFLLLAGNQFQGQLSSQICQLTKLNILDLSRNHLSGSIPSCINNLSFGERNFDFLSDITNPSIGIDPSSFYHFENFSFNYYPPTILFGEDEVLFMTKGSSFPYKGGILHYMSGLDLSSNQFTGEIPYQIGELHALHALNLSHNRLNGLIPESFHKLNSIESLDLSSNNLSGQIPLQLQDLYTLSVFNVSYNNLSGRAPDKGQFATFGDGSYKGNPNLSWIISNRGVTTPPPHMPPAILNGTEENDSAIDLTSFYWTFAVSYVMVIIILVMILWINPHWRRAWFYFVEDCLLRCFGQFLQLNF